MPATLTSLHIGIDWSQYTWKLQHDALEKAIADGHFTQPDHHLPGMSQVGHNIGYLNGGHVFNLDALRCKSLTDGIMLGRKIVQEYLAFYKKYVPGCENIELVSTASLMGVRESRRIVGEYELTIDDYLARRQFPDQIGLFNKFVDIHPYNASPRNGCASSGIMPRCVWAKGNALAYRTASWFQKAGTTCGWRAGRIPAMCLSTGQSGSCQPRP